MLKWSSFWIRFHQDLVDQQNEQHALTEAKPIIIRTQHQIN